MGELLLITGLAAYFLMGAKLGSHMFHAERYAGTRGTKALGVGVVAGALWPMVAVWCVDEFGG